MWKLELSEGIDFSIYLLGGFEPRTLRLYQKLVRPGETVLDIGANVGAHTLPLAKLVGNGGRVIAFEPTRYAFDKLMANIRLNPEIAGRISACQAMLVSGESDALAPDVYSSWPLFGTSADLHPEHKGRLMTTEGAGASTLDRALQNMSVNKVDFIKLDVDGNEPAVIAGARETLRRHGPAILMELAPYLYEAQPTRLEQMLEVFAGLGYSIADANTGRGLPMTAERLRGIIPVGGSRNVILRRV